MVIDYDRGVTHKRHPSGLDVYMYKDQPGVFLNAFGREVTPDLAAAAGFDTDHLLKEKAKRERMALAMAAIEEEFEGEAKQVKAKGEFKVVHVGFGRHNLLDPDGNKLNPRPLTKEEALKLLEQVAKGSDTEGEKED